MTPHPMKIMIKLEHGKGRYHAVLDSGYLRLTIWTDFIQALQAQGSTVEASRESSEFATESPASEGAVPYRFCVLD